MVPAASTSHMPTLAPSRLYLCLRGLADIYDGLALSRVAGNTSALNVALLLAIRLQASYLRQQLDHFMRSGPVRRESVLTRTDGLAAHQG